MNKDQTKRPDPLFWLGIAGIISLALPLWAREFESPLSLTLSFLIGRPRFFGVPQFLIADSALVYSAMLVALNFRRERSVGTLNLNVALSALGSIHSLFIVILFRPLFLMGMLRMTPHRIFGSFAYFFTHPLSYFFNNHFMGLAFPALFLVSVASLVVALIERANERAK